MKIKCVKTAIDNPDRGVINSELQEYLLINDVFWVFGLRFFRNMTYVYIFDNNHLFEAPLELFEVIDDTIPNEWNIKVWEKGEVTLWPSLFYKDEFIENFAERESNERLLFEELRLKIEQQT